MSNYRWIQNFVKDRETFNEVLTCSTFFSLPDLHFPERIQHANRVSCGKIMAELHLMDRNSFTMLEFSASLALEVSFMC